MVVAIDCDEVLRDFTGSLVEVYKKHYPDHVVKSITEWDLAEFFPIGKDIYKFAFEEHVHAIFAGASVLPGAKEFMLRLKATGNKVAIVTSQPKGKEWITCEWLTSHSIPYDSLHFASDKGVINADILLDDGQHNLEVFKGLPVAFDKSWNRTWDGFRAKTYNEFLDMVDRMKHEHGNA